MTETVHQFRRLWRATLSADSLLSFDEAAEALPGSPTDNALWLSAHVQPCGHVGGQAVYVWGDVLKHVVEQRDRGCASKRSGPFTSWRDVADVVGVSEDTVARRRTERGAKGRCFFATTAEVHAWWRALIEPSGVLAKPPRRKSPKASEDGPVDWSRVGKLLKEPLR